MIQGAIEKGKENGNGLNNYVRLVVGVILFGIAGVSLRDLQYKHYTDITREGTNLESMIERGTKSSMRA